MRRWESDLYTQDVKWIAELALDWNKLQDKNVLITGASGMIGTCMVDVLMYCNETMHLNCTVFAVGRNEQRGLERFARYADNANFKFVVADINETISCLDGINFHYIIHAASNTHPVAYATDPIGTMTTNVIGTYQMLELATRSACETFVFLSSVEVYGENRGDCDEFTESYCGYIDCNTLRAGYPESKRAGEALCQAYKKQKNLHIVIPRLSRTYGPTMLMSDTKAISQFIKKGIGREDIVLKSEGNQLYSYSYVADAVSGVFHCLFKGENGHAYNIASKTGNITLKELANQIADIAGVKVIFELPDAVEKAGYSTATKAIMSGEKLKALGWDAKYSIQEGMHRTIEQLTRGAE